LGGGVIYPLENKKLCQKINVTVWPVSTVTNDIFKENYSYRARNNF
jgi:hypothetical protein